MKTASQSGPKWQERAGSAANDYVTGSQQTTKDQSALAIASKPNMIAGFNAAMSAGLYEKGLQRSGKSGWIAGVTEKGAQNYPTGVSAASSLSKYTSRSGAFDAARGAAAALPRGPRGSAGNLSRVAAVVNALRAAKVGK